MSESNGVLPGLEELSLSSGVFSGNGFSSISHPGNINGEHSSQQDSHRSTTVRHPGYGPRKDVKTLRTVTKVGDRTRIVVPHSPNIGWRKGAPLCAEVPLLRGIQGKVPPSIRSFRSFYWEKRSNSAQKLLSLLTPLRQEGSREPLTQAVSPN